MRIESKLCHFSEDKIIVQVNGWDNDKYVGSALGEGSTVELAEDKAISRLHERLSNGTITKSFRKKDIDNESNRLTRVELPKNDNQKSFNVDTEPFDWSNDLAAIDSEIRRLKWTRDDEIKFLEKKLGYNNRNKITNYKQLINYLNMLKKIDETTLADSNINNLIEESEIILKELSWDYKKGREYLLKEFNVSARKDLNEKQLITFVDNLKSIRNKYLKNKTSLIEE